MKKYEIYLLIFYHFIITESFGNLEVHSKDNIVNENRSLINILKNKNFVKRKSLAGTLLKGSLYILTQDGKRHIDYLIKKYPENWKKIDKYFKTYKTSYGYIPFENFK